MEKKPLNLVTLNDFNSICRICLESSEDMLDIFRSGIDSQLKELTNHKASPDDKLPKSLCKNCKLQMENFLKFQIKAQSSDMYLRSLLLENDMVHLDKEKGSDETQTPGNFNKQTLRKRLKVSQNNTKYNKKMKKKEENKLYVITVPNINEEKENKKIYIRDLSIGRDNLKIMEFCTKFLEYHFVDQSFSQKCTSFDQGYESKKDESACMKYSLSHESKEAYNKVNVNMFIFQCRDCIESFDEYSDLTSHYLLTHNKIPFLDFHYTCPICEHHETQRNNFFNHLQSHKKEGLQFVKVNSFGKPMPLKYNEKDIFVNSTLKIMKSTLLRINLDSFTCPICNSIIESQAAISKHIETKHLNQPIDFCIRYICPVCKKLFLNNEKNFTNHLVFHHKENIYFIKVNGSGQPLEVELDNEVFLPYEFAKKFIQIYEGSEKIFKIINVNSCDLCDFVGESSTSLIDHFNNEHPKNVPPALEYICPVCSVEYKISEPDEKKKMLYEHLKIHKNEGVSFIEVNRNNTFSSCVQQYSDLFTQSMLFYSLCDTPIMKFDDIWCPDFIISSIDDSPTKYQCDLCQKEFNKKKTIIKHLKSHQNKEQNKKNIQYICEKCGKKCLGKINYTKHFLKHSKIFDSSGKRPVCGICNKIFARRSSLCSHIKQHVKEGVGDERIMEVLGIMCEKCGKSFSNTASLAKHSKVHKTGKENVVLKCDICNREFFRQSSFDRHTSAHLNPKYFECDICKFPVASAGSLQRHTELHKSSSNTFDCKSCKISFLTKESLTAHQTHTGHYMDRKPFECNVCHEKFFVGRKFAKHIKTHPKYKMGECTLCGKRLSTVQSLMLHIGRHFEYYSILCPHCGKQFFEEKTYHRHLLAHEGIKPFTCDVQGCEKSFYTMFELKRHKKYHNNTRDFVCSYCLKCFHEANHLKVHIRTHTGERPYICPHCTKGFITRTSCKNHIKLIHQGVGYDLIQSTISKKVAVFEAVEAVV